MEVHEKYLGERVKVDYYGKGIIIGGLKNRDMYLIKFDKLKRVCGHDGYPEQNSNSYFFGKFGEPGSKNCRYIHVSDIEYLGKESPSEIYEIF